MAPPMGKPTFQDEFPTFYRIGRILYLLYRSRVTRFVILPVILLIILIYGFFALNDALLARKHKRVERELGQLVQSVNQFKDKMGHYPDSLDELVQAGIVTNLPRDPFSKTKEPYKLINLNDGAMVRVYSAGEDGMDNHSIKDIVQAAHEEVYYGEKGKGLYETLQIEWTRDDPNNGMSDFMRGLLASNIDSKDTAHEKMDLIQDYGWDRTFEYLRAARDYVKRTGTRPSRVNPIPGIPSDFIDMACNDKSLDYQDILDLFVRNETAFDLIHKGAGKPYTKAVMPEDDISSAAPRANSLHAMYLNKALIAQGKWLEKQGDPDTAIVNYIDAIRFGQVIGLERTIIGKLIDNSMEVVAYKALIESVSQFEPEPEHLITLIQQIESLEQTAPKLTDCFRTEHLCFIESLNYMDYISDVISHPRQKERHLSLVNRICLRLMWGTMIRNNEKYWEYATEYISKPFPKSFKEDPKVILDTMDPISSFCLPDISSLKVNDHKRRSYSAAAKIILGLRHYHALHGVYPDSLDAIADLYETPPVDPFTTEPFIYEKIGDSFRIYSPGPELVDDKAALEYDPTNGTVSNGDIIYGQ